MAIQYLPCFMPLTGSEKYGRNSLMPGNGWRFTHDNLMVFLPKIPSCLTSIYLTLFIRVPLIINHHYLMRSVNAQKATGNILLVHMYMASFGNPCIMLDLQILVSMRLVLFPRSKTTLYGPIAIYFHTLDSYMKTHWTMMRCIKLWSPTTTYLKNVVKFCSGYSQRFHF